MSSRIAPMIGTTSLYSHMENSLVLLMKERYNYFVTRLEVFENLYIELDESRAALKEDCIEYVIYSRHKPLYMYPNWYVEACVDGFIFDDGHGYGGHMFYEESGEIAMSEGCYILRNFKGELKYMEYEDFIKYYEIMGGNR